MTNNKRLRNLLRNNIFPDLEDGIPKTTKIVAIKFYNGRAYYGKKYLKKDSDNDEPNEYCSPL